MAPFVGGGENGAMNARQRIEHLRIGAGVLTWAVVTGLAVFILVRNNGAIGLYLVLSIVNLAAMLAACLDDHISLDGRRAAHAIQLAAALGMGWEATIDFAPIYTIIWIGVGTGLYPARMLWWLLVGVMGAWYLIMTQSWERNYAWFSVALYGTFHLFALLSSQTAARAEAARDRAEFLNRELIATQHLLSEASRQSERTRIARDLHDLLGHHLTALSINLQIAERIAEGEAEEKIAESRALARLLLSDVRDAVSTLREESAVDFEQSIKLLVDKVPQLAIELEIDDDLAINEFEVAESLLRCIQEALTNTLRHARAKRSWIRVWQADDSVHLEFRDDGDRAADIQEGNGLKGMRERLAQLKGTLSLDRVDNALRLHVTIPLAPT